MNWIEEHDTRLFRFVVLIILILILLGVFTTRVWKLRIAAERVGVAHTIGSLQSAVGIKLSEQLVKSGIGMLPSLHHSNPMLLWNPPPHNYLGEFNTINAPMETGIWYFDIDTKMLVYRVRFPDHFSSSNETYPDFARYQLRLDYRDLNHNELFDPSIDIATGLAIQPVDHYEWLADLD